MAHFAELDENNIVKRVIVVNNQELLDKDGKEQEILGQAFCMNLFGGRWVQTSYNGRIRNNFAGKGFTYNQSLDAFVSPKPYNSWILNEETAQWEAPVAYPTDADSDTYFTWDEDTTSWKVVEPAE